MRTNGAVLVLAAAFLLVPTASRPDIGPKPHAQGAGVSRPGADMAGVDVEMTSEKVSLLLDRPKTGGDPRLQVTATFQMTNRGGEVDLEEGFPVGPVQNMDGFAIEVDGAAVECALIDCVKNGRAAVSERAGRTLDFMAPERDLWYVWHTHYAPGQERTHVVRYAMPAGVHYLPGQHLFFTGYLLHTGAPWKNAIGKAVVTLLLGDGIAAHQITSIAPPQAETFAGGWRWTFENFEPTAEHDIAVNLDLDRKPDAGKAADDARR